MRTKGFLNPQYMLKKDKGKKRIGKSPNRSVKLMYKFVKSAIKSDGKICEPLIYNNA